MRAREFIIESNNIASAEQGVAEAVAPNQKLQSSVLYHGTSTTAGYRGIANQGLKIDPKLIAQKYKGQENFAPLPGVYMTKEFGNAVRYSFMSNVPDEQYAEYIKQEPNGYVFEFLGKDLTTVSPDEDELGNLLKSLVNTKNLQPNLSKIVQAVPEELRVKLQQPDVSFETIAVAGKWLVDRISDSTIQYLMKRYHNVVNYSGIKPSAVWVIPKPNERFLRDRQGTNNTHNGYFNYANKFGKKYDLTEVKQGVMESLDTPQDLELRKQFTGQAVAEGTSPKLSAAPIKIGSIYRMKVNGSQTYGKVASINDDRGTVQLRRLNKDGSPYEGTGPDKDSDGRWIQQRHFHVTTPDNLGKRFQMDNMYGELVPYGTAKIPGTEPLGEDLSVSKADVVSVQAVAEGTEQSLSSMVSQDQAERNEYANFVKSQAGGDWTKGAKMYAQLKKRSSNNIFGDAARLNQFMTMKFDFDKFTAQDWKNYWLLAQHCDMDRAFQKNALSVIKKYQGEDHINYQYLYDRISCGTTGKQKYGTQDICGKDKQGVAEGSIKLSTDPGWFGAEVDDTGFDSLPVVNISADRLVGFEPDSKMNLPKSKTNVKKILAGLKKGDKLPPLFVRKYKTGYQVLDGHHRFWAYKLSGIKSIPVQIVPDKDIEEISKQGVAKGAGNDIEKIIQSFVASPVGQKYKQHDCKTVTRAFVTWAEQNNILTEVITFAPPSAEFIKKNPQFQGKDGQGAGHIMPIVNDNAIDFTVRQFGVSRTFENPLVTPTGSLSAVYGKFGYFTDKPAWFSKHAGGKSYWIGALNSIPSEIFNQNFGDEILEQGVAEDTEKVNPLTNAVISFYKPVVNQIEPGAVDDYVKQAKELLNQAPDPTIRSRMLEIFRKGQKDPMIQGGVITAIAAILTGGLLSSASRMGLSPAQTNILLQAVLNTVIPTIIARINNKSWRDTIKYTLASVGVGMTAAATLSEKRVTEGLSIDVPNEEWLQDKIDYAKSKGRDEWGAPFFGSTTAYVRPNPQVSVVRLELLKGMRNEQNNVRKTDLEWLMATMEKTGKLPPDPHGNEYAPFVMVAYNGEAWVNEGNHRIMAAYRLGWKKMPIEIKYFDGGERVEDGIMYPGKIGL